MADEIITFWRILASYVGIAAELTACRIAEIGNLWYTFAPKGYIPLRDFTKFGVGEEVLDPHTHAKFRRCGF